MLKLHRLSSEPVTNKIWSTRSRQPANCPYFELNCGSNLRALVAIIEQNQLSDGRVTIPDALVPYMGGQTILEPCNWG